MGMKLSTHWPCAYNILLPTFVDLCQYNLLNNSTPAPVQTIVEPVLRSVHPIHAV